MDINKFTNKSREALSIAQEVAITKNQQQVDIFHLLYGLFSQEDSIVPIIIKRTNIELEKLKLLAMNIIERYPKTTGAAINQIFISPELILILNNAEQEARLMQDEFISTEHLLLAVLATKTKAKDFLEQNGMRYDSIAKILKEVRGNDKIDSASPENKFQVLEKYTLNLTELAKEKKFFRVDITPHIRPPAAPQDFLFLNRRPPQKPHPISCADINLDTQSPLSYILPISKQVPIS